MALALIVVVVIAVGGVAAYLAVSGPSQTTTTTTTTTTPPPTVNIAGLVPLTGSFAVDGQGLLMGAQQAVKEINSNGGIKALGGAQLALRYTDTGSTPDTAVAALQKIVTQYNISGAFGSYGSALTTAEIPIAQQNHIPWVTLSLADSITQQNNTWVFDTSPLASSMATTEWNNAINIVKQKGLTPQVGILVTSDPSSTSELNTLTGLAQAQGIAIVYHDIIQSGLTDATTIALQIKAAAPNVFFMVLSSTPDDIVVINALTQQGVHFAVGPLGGGDYLGFPSIGQALGAKANGLTTVSYTWPTSASATISSNLAKALNVSYVYSVILQGYMDVYLYAAAMEYAHSANSNAIRNALATMTITSGPVAQLIPAASGTVHFVQAKPGQGYRVDGITALLVQWQNGIPYTIYPAQFATAQPLSS